MSAKDEMIKKHKAAIAALRDLSEDEAWTEDIVKNYPKYLPDFDEFVENFAEMLLPCGECPHIDTEEECTGCKWFTA